MEIVQQAPDGMTREPRITPIRQQILDEIAGSRNRNGEARITQRELARRTGVSLKGVNFAIKALVQAGVLLAFRVGNALVYKIPRWVNKIALGRVNKAARRYTYTRASVRSEVLTAEGLGRTPLSGRSSSDAALDASRSGSRPDGPCSECGEVGTHKGTCSRSVMRSGQPALFAGFEPVVVPRPPDARDAVKAYLEELGERPPRNAVGQIGRLAKQLIGEGFPAEDVVGAAREVGRRGWSPLALAQALVTVRRSARARAGANGSDPILRVLAEVDGFEAGRAIPESALRKLQQARLDLIDGWASWLVWKGRAGDVEEGRRMLEAEAQAGSELMADIVRREARRIQGEFDGVTVGSVGVARWFYRRIGGAL